MTRNKSPASGQCGEVPCAGRCPALRERPVSVGGLVCAGLRSHLHEEAGAERAADVDVVVPAGELGAAPREAEAVHDARQLLPHVVRRHQRAVVDKVVVAPLVGLMVWLEGDMADQYLLCIIMCSRSLEGKPGPLGWERPAHSDVLLLL